MTSADPQSQLRELELVRGELEQLQRLAAVGAWSWELGADELFLSDGMRAIFGFAHSEPLGLDDLTDRVHHADREDIDERLRLLGEGGPAQRRNARIIRSDGEERVIDGWTEAVFDPDGEVRGLRGVVQDVTERVRAEREREAIFEVKRELAESASLDEAVERVLGALAETTGWQVAEYWSADLEAGVLRCERDWLAQGEETQLRELAAISRRTEFAPGDGVPGLAWQARRPVWRDVDPGDDVSAFPRRAIAEELGLGGVLAFPLVAGEEVIGVIDLWRRERGEPAPELIELLGSIGMQIGQFIERTHAQAELLETRALNQRIVERALDAVISIDAGGTVLEFNPAAEETFGYRRDEVLGRELADMVIPERYRERHRRGLSRLRENGEPTLLGRRIELSARRADGAEFPIELTISRVTSDPPTYTGWIRDITERRRAEQALLDSRRLLAQTQQLAQIGGWEWAVDYDSVTAADEVFRLLGLEVSGVPVPLSHLLAQVHPAHSDRLRRLLDACAREGQSVRFERSPLAHPAGEVRVVEWSAERVEDPTGSRVVRGTTQDVTPEAELEAELATRARQQAAVAAFGSEALLSHDLHALVESAVARVAGILEVEHTAVMELLPGGEKLLLRAGTGWEPGMRGEFTIPAGTQSHAGYVIDRGEPVVSEDIGAEDRFEVPPKLHEHGVISCAAVVIATEGGPIGTLGAYAAQRRRFSRDDVTFLQGMANVLAGAFAAERTAGLERQLQQAQRLDSIGKLAGGIAHDFNNLLSVILNYADFASEETESATARSEIEEIKRAAERAAELTRQLLLFSRKDATSEEVVDPGAVVRGLETILRRTLGEHVGVEIKLAPAPWPVQIAGSLLEQVLLNLVLNSRDAMPEGGEITIEVANVPASRPQGAGSAEGPHVRLSVIDDGTGMEQEVAERAFEPFFTTKGEGEGTGLGLATAYGIVQRAGGKIELESTPGVGTAVHVQVPARVEEAPAAAPPARDGPRGGGETILLVEDEDAVRRLTRRILESAGYVVLDADGPDAAVEVWGHRGDEVHLLLTDVVMPGRSGVGLWQELAADRPDLEVVYMSGYAGDVLTDKDGGDVPGTLLEKPFSSAELLRVVRSALG